MKELNFHQKLGVKLNDLGLKVLSDLHDERVKNGVINGPFVPPTPDENGYVYYDMNELMSLFGSYFYVGDNIPFAPSILIDEKKLIKHKTNIKR
jgi:hypothetical protein